MTYRVYNAQFPQGRDVETLGEAVRFCTGWLRAWVETMDGEVVHGQRQPFEPA